MSKLVEIANRIAGLKARIGDQPEVTATQKTAASPRPSGIDEKLQSLVHPGQAKDLTKKVNETLSQVETKQNNVNYCPTCQEMYINRSKTLTLESSCRHGHKWHMCPTHGTLCEGHSGGSGGYSCTCQTKK